MITLSIDTATPTPGLALARGEVIVDERALASEGAGRRVAQDIHEILSDNELRIQDVGRIVVGVGPGGFTGLRIGMATALALGQALDIEVVGICSLETLALGMADAGVEGLLIPVIDARRREVFTGVYRVGTAGIETVVAPVAATVDAFSAVLASLDAAAANVAGDGVHRIAEVLDGRAEIVPDGPAHTIRAGLAIGWSLTGGARPVTPMYLRLPDAEVNRRLREGTSS